MKLTKELASNLYFILDELVPPLVRDSKWFMYIPFKFFFGKKADLFFKFKERAFQSSGREVLDVYTAASGASVKRESDLSGACLSKVLQNIKGKTVLDAGCGRGYLAEKLSIHYEVCCSDFVPSPEMRDKLNKFDFQAAAIEKLPYKDRSFDTVICSHTLEHVKNLQLVIKELRRVTKKRLIIIVPKQRPYKYTFDLHLHFFPYSHSLLNVMGQGSSHGQCEIIGRELFYFEDGGVSG